MQNLTKIPMKSQIPNDSVFRNAVKEALAEAEESRSIGRSAVQKALYCGQMFIEKKASLPHGQWLPWLSKAVPEICEDTAQIWMNAARNVIAGAGLDLKSLTLPLSLVLAASDGELSGEALEARQLLFDFVEGKTISDCLRGVLVNGDASHRIDRAINGKTKGGSRGEDRKDWPTFIGRKLSQVSTHLESFEKFTAAQVAATEVVFKSAIGKWPTGVLEMVRRQVKEEVARR